MLRISVIIPVLNEAKYITSTLTKVLIAKGVEVIVVDGGSVDETMELAKSWSEVMVLSGKKGRAFQMNQGAKVATGDVLLFLHGDTILPDNFDEVIRKSLESDRVVGGAFQLRIASNLWGIRVIEMMVYLRGYFCALPYGDQAIYVRKKLFDGMGGFGNLPIMEDFDFIGRLKRLGKIVMVGESVITSGRRWDKLGVIKTTFVNQLMVIGYFLKISPDKLARWYRGF